MEMVDTFNHLIPSDQLDESLVIGQNLECDASNEFASGLRLEDTLKNMLSDKDPMFGCATNQFNLLDNEDPAFPVAGSTDLDNGSTSVGLPGELKVKDSAQEEQAGGQQKKHSCDLECEQSGIKKPNKPTKRMIRGPPGRKPTNRLCKAFLIDKGVKGSNLKDELTLGGRINVNDLDCGSWLNPSVVLRRLTVTIGGFKIELLPGPSYAQTIDASQSVCFDDVSYGGEIGYTVLPGDGVDVQNHVPESVAEVDLNEKISADDAGFGLGPYVNPNDVQAANGTLTEKPSTQETKPDNESVPAKRHTVGEEKGKVKQPESNNKPTAHIDKTDYKHKTVAKPLLGSNQGMTLDKSKDSVLSKTTNSNKEHKAPQNMPSKAIQRGNINKIKSQKEKQDISPLKRPAEPIQSEHATKVHKIQAPGPNKMKPKVPSSPNSVVKKSQSVSNRTSDHQGPAKHAHPPNNSSKVDKTQPAQSIPASLLKPQEEEGQDKSKVKKPEKILQRQKSKNARSISVEEPQLFVPDNAPVTKKESVEEQPATSEAIWDGNNCCGLCKKHHNNMFMVGCGRCDDWFHGDCVGLDLNKVREMEEEDQMYVCLKCCEEESKKVEPESPTVSKPEVQAKTAEVQDQKQPPKPRPGPSQISESGGHRPPKDQDGRDLSDGREATHRTAFYHKQETKSKSSSASKKPVSVETIRRNVRDSLKEILTQRLKESVLNISVERAYEVAKKTERELFHLYKDTDNKYKNKYRSLMFNLKDTKNNVLFKRVLKGDISPANLIRMSPEELASKELAAWRKRENRHTIEMIEKEQREVERRPITKITHKGEIEIESQEPVKASEPVELEPPPKVTEVSVEPPKTRGKEAENTIIEKDTTSLHKSHLFDLHCKICTGRMAPPVEEAPTKVIKVATTVVRRQSTKAEETQSTTPNDDDLHITVLEESLRNAKSGYEGRLDHHTGGKNEVAFLSNLKSLWRGFIHMHAVAKLVTKAFPVSGILDNLTEDLPDSIQVGGRISPQTVWDYLEKIRATGTKEVCLIRFSPETEEDEISYTLLYAYFSSRRRFGVVSNNLKQVKDMYLIPLGATEKVPHQLVPFDGPGLENNRANLLLGLIIRQRPKKDFISVDVGEPATSIPEVKPVPVPAKETRTTEEEEQRFLSSLAPLKKDKEKALKTSEVIDEPAEEAFEEPSAQENNIQDSQKPLRFLPGVLLGLGGFLPPLPDVGFKSAGDAKKTQPVKKKTETPSGSSKSPTAAAPRERFVIKKKESKPLVPETEPPCPADASAANNSTSKDGATANATAAPLSLKDKPPDVSTEAFLSSLLPAQTDSAAPTNKADADLLSETEKGTTEGNSPSQPASQPAADQTSSTKPPLSGILKKSTAYPAEDKTTAQQKDKASNPDPSSPKPVPVLSSPRSEPLLPFHQGYLQLSQAKHKPEEKHRAALQSFSSRKEEPVIAQTITGATETSDQKTEEAPQASTNIEASSDSVDENNAAAVAASTSPKLQSQIPSNTPPPPPSSFSSPGSQDHSTQEAQDSSSQDLNEPQEPESYFEPSSRALTKRPEERYSDPWERPRATEDRDHHGRHSHHRDSHHGKKSRHHDRERRHSRSHEDKQRDRSRHHGHSEDRHGEKRKERHHGDEHRHKERHRHRRDSDYENGRRSSKDSYS